MTMDLSVIPTIFYGPQSFCGLVAPLLIACHKFYYRGIEASWGISHHDASSSRGIIGIAVHPSVPWPINSPLYYRQDIAQPLYICASTKSIPVAFGYYTRNTIQWKNQKDFAACACIALTDYFHGEVSKLSWENTEIDHRIPFHVKSCTNLWLIDNILARIFLNNFPRFTVITSCIRQTTRTLTYLQEY